MRPWSGGRLRKSGRWRISDGVDSIMERRIDVEIADEECEKQGSWLLRRFRGLSFAYQPDVQMTQCFLLRCYDLNIDYRCICGH